MAREMDRRATSACSDGRLGDKVRLADTELFIEVEEDRCVARRGGSFGGGKVSAMAWGSPSGSCRRVP